MLHEDSGESCQASWPGSRIWIPDLLDLTVAVGDETLALRPQFDFKRVTLSRVGQFLQTRLVHHLLLGNLRLVVVADLGDRSLVRIREGARRNACFGIFLAQSFHR